MNMIKSSDLPIYIATPPGAPRRGRKDAQAEKKPIFNAVGLYGSGRVARSGVEKLVGNKRLYHGTTLQAAEQIRKNGLLPQFGGTGAGAPVSEFVKTSTNKCHVTTRPLIAKLFEKHQDPRNPLDLVERDPEVMGREVVKSTVSRGGPGLVKLSVPYECFAQMQEDPYLEFGYTTEKSIEPVYVKDGSKNRIERMLKLTRLYPGYVRQFPCRAAGGAVQTTAALMMVNYFGTKLWGHLKED